MTVEGISEEDIFRNAIGFEDRNEQAEYVKKACGDNTELCAAVEALLLHHYQSSILDAPALESSLLHDTTPITEEPGTKIGRYKLLEKIGEGGMAVVYMAEQTEPIRRKVALKIIKLGMDTKSVIARFEAERQALAMMDHPNIAKVLDAGATEAGRPYFVMELVTGVSITEYCDKNNLSTNERLALFIQVCNAVQHAHQKGIIHRDIKPTNVMVTRHEGNPVPKVIDFGIAKATNQRLTEKTLFTRFAHIIGTPTYMSPEQAELSDMDIDTRSDIYSLGVLLYELLTGTTPFSEEELRKAGHLEMQRIIREEEPTKPSTKLSSLGATLTEIAQHRRVTPDALRKLIRGDLDWIVMKALEKARSRRYDTVSAVAADIQRHLDHEPVLARAPSPAYRLRKFMHRHRSRIAVAATLVVLVGVAIVGLTTGYKHRRELARAESLVDGGILSDARGFFARAEYQKALELVQGILDSPHVGPDARLLYAGILIEGQQSEVAVPTLEALRDERPEIAAEAYSLLAQVLWESESSDEEKLQKVEEYRRIADELFPETAEAYFLRAMTGLTIKEKLEMLDAALDRDPGHYESRRLRAFTYCASKKHQSMKEDALVMIVLRPRDALGYSLRAKAFLAIDDYQEAIECYDRAIGLPSMENPEQVELKAERCEALIRMGRYDVAAVDARAYLTASPSETILRFHLFCALTALGRYPEASSLLQQGVASTPEARGRFRNWAMKYVFDVLGAGRSWHPPNSEPSGAAFLPMREAQEMYHHLSDKARRLIPDGFTADWHPDGTRLTFSLGVYGCSGIAIFDVGSQETELLIVPGEHPKWSPDGRHIVFVRSRPTLRLSELTAFEHGPHFRSYTAEEVWIMKADGTRPKRLVRGSSPSWSCDSRHVYYHRPADRMLCSISIEDGEAESKGILSGCDSRPSVSPDDRYVAYVSTNDSLKIVDMASQSTIAESRVPAKFWGGTWSPDSHEFCLTAGTANGRTGLWIYNVHRRQVEKVLSGAAVTTASWAPGETAVALDLGPPFYEIWIADLDPNIPTVAVFGPSQTVEEHYRERLRHYTNIIEEDPEDAEGYFHRAHYYDCLQEGENALADMDTYVALLSRSRQIESHESWLQNFHAGFQAGTPANLGLTVNSPDKDWAPNTSADNLTLYFTSERPDGCGAPDIYMTTRTSVSDPWGAPVNLGSTVNSLSFDGHPCLSADGLSLLFASTRSEGHGSFDIWLTTRKTERETWGKPANLGPSVNSADSEWGPSLSGDGLSLFFTSARASGLGGDDIYVSRRATTGDAWGEPYNLGREVNSSADEGYPNISPDGLLLFFCCTRAGGLGGTDIWVTRRATEDDNWGTPVNLGPTVNSLGSENDLSVSSDGSTLYFSSDRPGGAGRTDLWQLQIAPIPWHSQRIPDWGPAPRSVEGKERKGGGVTRGSVE